MDSEEGRERRATRRILSKYPLPAAEVLAAKSSSGSFRHNLFPKVPGDSFLLFNARRAEHKSRSTILFSHISVGKPVLYLTIPSDT